MNPILTAGYGNKPVRSLVLAARQHNALVVDIRCSPRSKNPGYDQKDLIALLDSRYIHLPQLGNVNYSGDGPIQLADAEDGLKWLLRMAHARTLIVLCGCGQKSGCHREVVADLLSQRGYYSEELTWPLSPSLNLKGLPDVALSVLQPHAWLITNGYKPIENREWDTDFRGPFLVHTGKDFDLNAYCEFMQDPEWRRILPKAGDFDRGGIVGYGEVRKCVCSHESPWFFGPFGFVLENGQPLPFMPLRGAPRFFSVHQQLGAMK